MEQTASAPSARQRITATAHDLFYREGIRATGIDRIIKEAGVTKVTFYRHFPSKNDLITAYLAYRHGLWMTWFKDALARHGAGGQDPLAAVVKTLQEWFRKDGYRGCAFINAVVELDGAIPEVTEIARRHKAEMVDVLAALLKPGRSHGKEQLVALAIDGAIIRAQMDGTATAALKALKRIFQSL